MIGRSGWRTPGIVALALICLAIALGVPYLRRDGSRPADRTRTGLTPPSSTTPTTPPATLGPILGAGVRMPSYPQPRTPDLTVARADAASGLLHARSVEFTPAAGYAAGDSLEDTGPGSPGPLSGLPTRPALAHRRPVAVVVDNYDPDARPQAGLNRASLVFETLAEGGITRLMPVYLEADAPIVGPVRSTRVPFDAWADGLGAVYGHAGGSADALAEVPRLASLIDADPAQVPRAAARYWRSDDRRPLHDLYTSTEGLRAYAPGKGGIASIPSLPHKAPAAPTARPRGGTIGISFSSAAYSVQYRYDPICNCYPRSVNGAPQVDAFSARRIAPANVAVLFADIAPDPASGLPGSLAVQAVGAGRALYFRDGSAIEGQWRKTSTGAPLALLDAQGRPLAFNPGQTWIEVVPLGSPVSWQIHP